jgi:Flp pilus assembly protein TadD
MDLAGLLFQTGDARKAATEFRKVLAVEPDLPESQNNLAWILATSADPTVRNGTEAVQHAECACELTSFKETSMVGTLAAAYAEAGRFPEAVTTAESAVKLANACGQPHLADINNQLLPLYRAGIAYHERPTANSNP